jgi:hypothetical protein
MIKLLLTLIVLEASLDHAKRLQMVTSLNLATRRLREKRKTSIIKGNED